jgi:hypothetical protein
MMQSNFTVLPLDRLFIKSCSARLYHGCVRFRNRNRKWAREPQCGETAVRHPRARVKGSSRNCKICGRASVIPERNLELTVTSSAVVDCSSTWPMLSPTGPLIWRNAAEVDGCKKTFSTAAVILSSAAETESEPSLPQPDRKHSRHLTSY